MERGVDALRDLARRHHPVQLIGAQLLAGLAGYVDAGGEYHPPVPTHFAEYTTLTLIEDAALWTELRPTPPLPVDEWVDALRQSSEAADALAPSVLMTGPHPVFEDTHARLSAQQQFWYDPVLAEAEAERLEPLLELAADDIAKAAGAPLADLISVLHHCATLIPRWAVWVTDFNEEVDTIEGFVTSLRARVASGGPTMAPGFPMTPLLSLEALARGAQVSSSSVEAFMRVFALSPGDIGPDDDYLHRLARLRERPVLRWKDSFTMSAGYGLLAGFRPGLERLLEATSQKAFARYGQKRGRWVEKQALSTFERLRPDEVWRSLRVGEPSGNAPERDGLVVIDSVALAIEVKGGGLPPSARAGNEASQRRALERLLRDAAAQAASLATAVARKQPVDGIDRDNRRRAVELGGISRLLPVVVTLEDVSGATSRAELLGKFFSQQGAWQIALDELDWYTRALELPAQVLHYALVRPRLERQNVAVFDEGDWFRLYHAIGAANTREFLDAADSDPRKVVLHGGDYRRGRHSDATPIWRSPLHELLRRWDATREWGWLEASFAVLGLADGQAERLPGLVADARERVTAGEFPVLTLRPQAERGTALHVFAFPADVDALETGSVAVWAREQAADAERHIVLVAPTPDISDLVIGPAFLAEASALGELSGVPVEALFDESIRADDQGS